MNPGKLDKRITIIGPSGNQNSYGETEGASPVIATVWANIKPLQGREYFWAKQVHAELTSKVIIRYRQDILPNMRIKHGKRTLEIIAPPININEQNRYLELLCKEVI
ncbi:phage head closure protein [Bacillus sp. OK048]|uniref:phage head closure protein n=1 Tax=Bacillus sp. OK048 TaxID=1882761 RepID=UPI0008838D95|nr:phage head closure protein [Bacillus sp. OK048]SDM17464.1 phage head-tail adaptor, putative, SPP1 family [Bacillus sp. OK048]